MIRHRDIGIEPRAKVPSDRHRINVGITYADMGIYKNVDTWLVGLEYFAKLFIILNQCKQQMTSKWDSFQEKSYQNSFK